MDNVDPPELVDSNAEDYTRKLFNTWDGFEEGINQIFGDRDQEFVADIKLRQLRHHDTVANYVAEFQRYLAILQWDDTPARSQFYVGLKDNIKDEIHRLPKRPESLDEMIEKALHFDQRN